MFSTPLTCAAHPFHLAPPPPPPGSSLQAESSYTTYKYAVNERYKGMLELLGQNKTAIAQVLSPSRPSVASKVEALTPPPAAVHTPPPAAVHTPPPATLTSAGTTLGGSAERAEWRVESFKAQESVHNFLP